MSPDESIMYLNLDMDEQTSLFSELDFPSRNLQLKPQQNNDLLSDSSSTDFNTSQNVEKEFGIQPSILTETLPEEGEGNLHPIKYETSEMGLNDRNFEITDKMILEKKSLRRNKDGKEGRKKITLERNRVAAKNSRLKKKLWHSNLSINLHLLKIKNEEQHQLNNDLINNLRRAKQELLKLGPVAQKKVEEINEPPLPSNLPKLPPSIDWKELDKMVDNMDFDQLAADAIATNTDPSQFCFTPIDSTATTTTTTTTTSNGNTNLDNNQDFNNTLRTINLDFSDK